MMFLTERQRLVLDALRAGGQASHDLSLRLGLREWMVREDLRHLRSEQLVKLTIDDLALWELTPRGRTEVQHQDQLKLKGVNA